jgi:hypothetical protein
VIFEFNRERAWIHGSTPYSLSFDNGIAVGRWLEKVSSLAGELNDIAFEASRKGLLRDAYTCAQALLDGRDLYDEIPRMPEFIRVATFLSAKAREGFPYSVQVGCGVSNDHSSPVAWIELRAKELRGWKLVLARFFRPHIVVRGGLVARVSNEDGIRSGWGAIY